MYTDLKGKVAVITGGSKGIGNAIARRLSEEKMKVVINYHSDKEGAEETVEELKKVGGADVGGRGKGGGAGHGECGGSGTEGKFLHRKVSKKIRGPDKPVRPPLPQDAGEKGLA